jgi:hypothetical protein
MLARSRWSSVSACLLGAAGPVLAACDLTQLDAIAEAPGGPPAGLPNNPDSAGVATGADAAAEARATDAGDVFHAAVAADAADGPPLDGGPFSSPCTSAVAALAEWTFDSTVEGWTWYPDTGGQATLGWNDTIGNPSPGSLEADVTPMPTDAGVIGGAIVAYNLSSPTDLSRRTIAAWVRLESGAPPHLKTMVQTGAQYSWADNGTIYLTPNTWTCVSLDVSTPSSFQQQYDPTQVIRIGFEMLSTTPFVMAIDDVRYY